MLFPIIEGVRRRFLIDTRSLRDIIPKSYLSNLEVLQPSVDLRCYDGSMTKNLSEPYLNVTLLGGIVASNDLLVVEMGKPLLRL